MLSSGSESRAEEATGKKPTSGAKAGGKRRNGDRFLSQFTEQTASTRLPNGADACENNGEQTQDGDFGEEDEWMSDSEGNGCDDMLDSVRRGPEGRGSKEADVVPERNAKFTDSFDSHMSLLKQVMREQGLWGDVEEDDSEEQDGGLVDDGGVFDTLEAEAFPSVQLLLRRLNSENFDVVEDTSGPRRQPTPQRKAETRPLRRLPAWPAETSQGVPAATSAPRRLSAWPLRADMPQDQDEVEQDRPRQQQSPAPGQRSPPEDSGESSCATTMPSKTGEGAPASAQGARSPDTGTEASSTSRASSSKASQAPFRGHRYYTPCADPSTETSPAQPQPPAEPRRLGAAPPSHNVAEGLDEAVASSSSLPAMPCGGGEEGEEGAALDSGAPGQTPHAGSISRALRRRNRSLT